MDVDPLDADMLDADLTTDVDSLSDDENVVELELNSSVVLDAADSDEQFVGNAHQQDKTSTETPDADATTPVKALKPRSYQQEMLEKSLEQNIIVAMDTGSGKTHIAVLRIATELERCPADKLVWFLAPSVVLCQQQHRVLRDYLPAYQSLLLVGDDGVDHWSEQSIWDAVLRNVRIVVSTPKVLEDALTHAFVLVSRLALLIFDEAHRCVGNYSANLIMQQFYYPQLEADPKQVPHVLGLSASPVMNAKAGGLERIEHNLNAISKTPKVYREELTSYVNPPVMRKLVYSKSNGDPADSELVLALWNAYQGIDIREDPYVLELMMSDRPGDERRLQKAFRTNNTYCQEQMKSLWTTSAHVHHELGVWAADYYILNSINRLRASLASSLDVQLDWNDAERSYLLKILNTVTSAATPSGNSSPMRVSAKVDQLIDLLIAEHTPNFTGLIFVEQRAVVAVLSALLREHPRTKDLFACGSFVGTSNNPNRKAKSLGELLDPRTQTTTLDELRSGEKNIIVATAVLEEGIDVSACHIVICFDPPKNLISFVQRRGRARKMQSEYVIMMEQNDAASKQKDWAAMEEDMRRAYMDDMREVIAIQEKEDIEEDTQLTFKVEATRALLTLDQAIPHLHHFCAVIPREPYVDPRPEFTTEEDAAGLLTASVLLPISVDPAVRQAKGQGKWKTERMAKKEAAFQAYLALHKAGLVDDHLLPLLRYDSTQDELGGVSEKRPAIVKVSSRFNPWIAVAQLWESKTDLYSTQITIRKGDQVHAEMFIDLPLILPVVSTFTLFWNAFSILEVEIADSTSHSRRHKSWISSRCSTYALLEHVFAGRLSPKKTDYIAHFRPALAGPNSTQLWGMSLAAATVHKGSAVVAHDCGLVRHIPCGRKAYVFQGWIETISLKHKKDFESLQHTEELYIKVAKFSKRADFLHSLITDAQPDHHKEPALLELPASECEIDSVPFSYTQAIMFIPSILHRIEIALVADHLCNNLLPSVHLCDLDLVTTAISASSAGETSNYQRLEFLGDSILKLFTSVQLLAEHPNWHEGYLTASKGRTVSNSRLARAALQVGLDKYILTKSFTGAKWRPMYVSDLLKVSKETAGKREMSTKTLADVVEALIGAAWIEGGIEKARACLKVFLPEMAWKPLSRCVKSLIDLVPSDMTPFPPQFSELEKVIGYKFSRKILLVEAMTHPSYNSGNLAAIMSYQRLEFLGDAVLDHIVVTHLFHRSDSQEMSHGEMYWTRAALVNRDFLGFLCMDAATSQYRAEVSMNGEAATVKEKTVPIRLWQFMRHSSADIPKAQKTSHERYESRRDEIRHNLKHGHSYPWTSLAALRPDKFFSDLFESVLGAVYVDSQGDEAICEKVLEKLGLMAYLRRVIHRSDQGAKEVDLVHPKGQLGILAGTQKVKYLWAVEKAAPIPLNADNEARNDKSGEEKKTFTCTVKVGDEEVVTVGGGKSKAEIVSRAAEEAVEVLRKREKLDSKGGSRQNMASEEEKGGKEEEDGEKRPKNDVPKTTKTAMNKKKKVVGGKG
ncbi:MAG: Dicer-like protein 2 [Caeruleum heppii]|nr:MAG: Dicer-like protein 2 [Caeruleum heppii]